MKPRIPVLVAPALVVLLAAGCGGSSSPKKQQAGPATVTTAPQSTKGHQPGATQAGKPGVPIVGGTKKSSGGGSAPTVTTAPPVAGKPAVATFTAPGTYTFDSKGQFTAGGQAHDASGTESYKVDKPSGSTQHSSLGGDQGGGTEQDLVHRDNGTFLARLKINASGYAKEFHPAQPVLGVPKPAVAGRTWSWTMTSTDGKTTAHYSASFVRQESVTIGGTRIDAWVIESTLKLSGDIDYTDHETTDYDPSRLLELRKHSRLSGAFSGIPFNGDVTSTLRSVRPS